MNNPLKQQILEDILDFAYEAGMSNGVYNHKEYIDVAKQIKDRKKWVEANISQFIPEIDRVQEEAVKERDGEIMQIKNEAFLKEQLMLENDEMDRQALKRNSDSISALEKVKLNEGTIAHYKAGILRGIIQTCEKLLTPTPGEGRKK